MVATPAKMSARRLMNARTCPISGRESTSATGNETPCQHEHMPPCSHQRWLGGGHAGKVRCTMMSDAVSVVTTTRKWLTQEGSFRDDTSVAVGS